jgi:hypothetical protein
MPNRYSLAGKVPLWLPLSASRPALPRKNLRTTPRLQQALPAPRSLSILV